MDTSQKPPSVLSLCTGYGGIELGLKRVFGKINILAHVEIEAYAITNLVAKMETGKMDPAPIWTDLKTLPLGPFSRGIVDILTGRYPCQPFSKAGKMRGKDDPRHLWPFIRDAIKSIRPAWCFFENVEGHVTEGLYDVLDDLGGMGYRSTWRLFSAAETGLPHIRQRVFILAHAGRQRSQGQIKAKVCKWRPKKVKKRGSKYLPPDKGRIGIWSHEGYESESVLHRRSDGIRNWDERIRLLGNGVVPMTAELAFRSLHKELSEAK